MIVKIARGLDLRLIGKNILSDCHSKVRVRKKMQSLHLMAAALRTKERVRILKRQFFRLAYNMFAFSTHVSTSNIIFLAIGNLLW